MNVCLFLISGCSKNLSLFPTQFQECLEIELTETNELKSLETAISNASKLVQLNTNLVLDDFGTGFSSIEYLSHFKFASIKIDYA